MNGIGSNIQTTTNSAHTIQILLFSSHPCRCLHKILWFLLVLRLTGLSWWSQCSAWCWRVIIIMQTLSTAAIFFITTAAASNFWWLDKNVFSGERRNNKSYNDDDSAQQQVTAPGDNRDNTRDKPPCNQLGINNCNPAKSSNKQQDQGETGRNLFNFND